MLTHTRSPAMLKFKPSTDGPSPPAIEHNTTQTPLPLDFNGSHESPKNVPLGPVVALLARASDLNDHHYHGAILDGPQMHNYLRGLLVMMSDEHRKIYGSLGARPQRLQTIVHAANHKLAITCRTTKYLASALDEARECKTGCIFILYNWDGWTTDSVTICEMCDLFKDVPFTLHIYANGHGVPREFYEADAHKVHAYFRGRARLQDSLIAHDRNTALFIRMIEALHTLHGKMDITNEQRRELSKYDSRLA